MQIIPIRDLKNTVEIEKRCTEANGPVFITKNGYRRLVVMDIEYYEKTIQQLYEAREINKGIEDMNDGKFLDSTAVMDSMRAKYGL